MSRATGFAQQRLRFVEELVGAGFVAFEEKGPNEQRPVAELTTEPIQLCGERRSRSSLQAIDRPMPRA